MLRLPMILLMALPMVEMIQLEDGKELIIVNDTCEVIVETKDVLSNYARVEKQVLAKCANDKD